MSSRRVVLLVTCLVATGLLVWLTVAKWDSASKVAAVVTAVAAVAAVGVAVWAALPGSGRPGQLLASRTGKTSAGSKGRAVSGIVAPAGKATSRVRADRTGDADAGDGGEATSGVRLS